MHIKQPGRFKYLIFNISVGHMIIFGPKIILLSPDQNPGPQGDDSAKLHKNELNYNSDAILTFYIHTFDRSIANLSFLKINNFPH